MGAPGRIASQVILKDWSKGFRKSSRANSTKSSPNSHPASRAHQPAAELANSSPVEKN
jgi:hypothetical protein